jgi:hypothetical protein
MSHDMIQYFFLLYVIGSNDSKNYGSHYIYSNFHIISHLQTSKVITQSFLF